MIETIEKYINKELIPQLNKKFDAIREGFEQTHKALMVIADVADEFEKRISTLESKV